MHALADTICKHLDAKTGSKQAGGQPFWASRSAVRTRIPPAQNAASRAYGPIWGTQRCGWHRSFLRGLFTISLTKKVCWRRRYLPVWQPNASAWRGVSPVISITGREQGENWS